MKAIRRNLFWLIIVLLLGFVGCSKSSKENPKTEKAAIEAALNWVSLVDSGDYARSWEEAATYFKNVVSKTNWQQSLTAVREPLGEMIYRDLKSTHYTTALPGAPDGKYVVIQFNSSFENKKSAIETITPMLDNDNQWRVSGYYIK